MFLACVELDISCQQREWNPVGAHSGSAVRTNCNAHLKYSTGLIRAHPCCPALPIPGLGESCGWMGTLLLAACFE